MAPPKLMRSTRMEKLLPLRTDGGGLITGIVVLDYHIGVMHNGKLLHEQQACCQDVTRWHGTGESWRLDGPEDLKDQPNLIDRIPDPYWWKGYRNYRNVVCGHCGTRVNAHEYLP